MSYGLQVTSFDAGGNSITQIDTELGLTNYVIVASGQGYSVNVENIAKDRLIFVKPIDSNNVYIGNPPQGGAPGTLNFITDDWDGYDYDGEDWNTASIEQDVYYMIVEDVSAVTPVGDYGLQVKQVNGDVAFDSRCITTDESFQITSVVPLGSVGGYGSGSSDRLTTDPDAYVHLNWSDWDSLGTKDGIIRRADGIYHFSIVVDEPDYDPTSPYYPTPIYYTNYSNILIADKV